MVKTVFTKDFSKRDFYEAIIELAEGSGCENEELIIAAANAEIERLDAAKAKAGEKSGEKKDVLQSEYACEIRAAVKPLLTHEFISVDKLVETMTNSGKVSAKTGKPYPNAWVARVLNGETDVVKGTVTVVKTGKDGLKGEKPATAYKLA